MRRFIQTPISWKALSLTVIILFCISLINAILPTYRNWTNLNNNIKLQKEQIAQGRDWQSTILKLDNENKRLENKFEAFVNTKGGLDSLTEILQLLNNVANLNNINIVSIRPGEELEFTSYKQRELFLEAKGKYNSIGSFFAELEEGSSSILIEASKIYSEETGLKAEIQLTVISMKEEL